MYAMFQKRAVSASVIIAHFSDRARASIRSALNGRPAIARVVESGEDGERTMASTSGAGTGKGAAEEPEPEPGESPYTATSSASATTAAAAAAAAAAPYDPREYQVHPDDRGGGGGGELTKKKGGGGKKGATGKAKGEDAATAKAKGKGKGKEDEDEDEGDEGTHRCGNCDAPDAKSKCKGCGVEYYCNRECQTVRCR